MASVHTLKSFTLAAAATLLALNAFAADAETAQLRKEIDELRERLAAVARKTDEAEAKAKAAGSFSFDEKGVKFDTADKNFRLRIRGLLQTDFRAYFDDGRASTDKFVLRRARPIIEVTLAKDYDVVLVPEFGDAPASTPFLLDAYLNAAPFGVKDVQFQIGKLRSTVGFEMNQSDSNGFFVERSLATRLVSNRDLGVKVWGETAEGVVLYSLGFFNGAPDGASPSYAGDFADGKEVAGFITIRPFANSSHDELGDLSVGLGASRREKTGSTANTGLVSYRSAGLQSFFNWDATAFTNGESSRITPYIGWYAGPFGMLAEYVVSETAVSRTGAGVTSDTIRNTAWNVSAGWVITGENSTYKDGVTPEGPISSGGIGAWQVVVRYDELKIDGDAFRNGFASRSTSASDARSFALGLNWYATGNIRFGTDYSHTDFDSDGPASALLRHGEDALIFRAQVQF